MDKLTVEEKLDLISKSGWMLAYDGCHKIYFLQDEQKIELAYGCGYEDCDIYPASSVKDLFENSCSLRFVSRLGSDNDDFKHEWNIDQFELEKEQEEKGEE